MKGKYGEPQDWDGFSSIFIVLAAQFEAALVDSERQWLAALKTAGEATTPGSE